MEAIDSVEMMTGGFIAGALGVAGRWLGKAIGGLFG